MICFKATQSKTAFVAVLQSTMRKEAYDRIRKLILLKPNFVEEKKPDFQQFPL